MARDESAGKRSIAVEGRSVRPSALLDDLEADLVTGAGCGSERLGRLRGERVQQLM